MTAVKETVLPQIGGASWNTPQIEAAMRKRFCPPEWGLLFNVSIHQGARYVDALAHSQWRSRGLQLHGFEFKASRSDWLRELKRADKADAAFAYCHYWWLVVGDTKIVKEGELPAGWGLLVPNGDSLRIAAQSALNLDARAVSPALLAAVFRRANEQSIDETAVKRAHARGFEEGHQKGLERGLIANQDQREFERLQRNYTDLQRKVREFEEASGIPVSGWQGGKRTGELVKLVSNQAHINQHLRGLQSAAANARMVAAEAERSARELEEILKAEP